MENKLAILGGPKAVNSEPGDMFTWPIINEEIEDAVLAVLRSGNMSGKEITKKFEAGFAEWHNMKYALGHNNGTAALHAAMFALGVGVGDEIICPATTYWASCLQAFSLGATVVFADIDPETLCIDPNDIEKRISARTKAIVVVHYQGMPAEMDSIMAIAQRHKIKIMEDVSHAHGALYKGKMVGTFGDVAGFSLMSTKSFACGEAGMLLTNDRKIYDMALAFGHYIRHGEIETEEIKADAGLPWGGYKYRMNQLSSAMGLVQLKKYPHEMAEIDRSMNYFWDLLEGVPGIRAHRPKKDSGSTKGGWYGTSGLYYPEELGGLSVSRFCEAVRAEGSISWPGCNKALHLHPLFNTKDVYNHGKPTRLANLPANIDIRQKPGELPVSEGLPDCIFKIPLFKKYRPEVIEEHAEAFRKVAINYRGLIAGDSGSKSELGSWALSSLK
jgi:perosamine synthetase